MNKYYPSSNGFRIKSISGWNIIPKSGNPYCIEYSNSVSLIWTLFLSSSNSVYSDC